MILLGKKFFNPNTQYVVSYKVNFESITSESFNLTERLMNKK